MLLNPEVENEHLISYLVTGCSLCRAECACGVSYFCTGPNSGDFSEGELECLRESAAEDPEKCVERPDDDCIEIVRLFGKEYVAGCPCGRLEKMLEAFKANIDDLTKLVIAYHRQASAKAKFLQTVCDKALVDIYEATNGPTI